MINRSSLVSMAVFVAALTLVSSDAGAQLPSKIESKCAAKLGKASVKMAQTIFKETGSCKLGDVTGEEPDTCPNGDNAAKILGTRTKIEQTAEKGCKSLCSVSTSIECVSDALCPPNLGGSNQACSEGAANKPFDMRNIGFPGPNCGTLTTPTNIGTCVADNTDLAANDLNSVVFGSLGSSSVSGAAADCLATINKNMQKLVLTIVKGVGKCRASINKGKLQVNPATCKRDDLKLAAKITKTENKLLDGIDGDCTDTEIMALDLCGGGIATVPDAKTCLVDAAHEVADTTSVPASRAYAPSMVSLIEAAFPPAPVCGDNKVNQVPNSVLLLGEECDGTDVAGCSGGGCFPPGDVFECSCDNVPRLRQIDDASQTDSDAGWTGNSHDQGISDLGGFFVELQNCNCGGFTGAECTGGTTDAVCDVVGRTKPVCSGDPTNPLRCDATGNTNFVDEDKDCFRCDEWSMNSETFCTDSDDCQSRCYDDNLVDQGPCNVQSDCGAGEVCRGQCDKKRTCVITPNGGPLPVSAANAAVCQQTVLNSNVTGTRNIVTGELEHYFDQLSKTFFPDGGITRPCPVCGGFCVGGPNELEICKGTCEVSGDPCQFDSDCGGEICTTVSEACPGGFCQLSLVCANHPDSEAATDGQACNLDYVHPFFGNMSNDCPPFTTFVNAPGFAISANPETTGTLSLPKTLPCSKSGFKNYDCLCPQSSQGSCSPASSNPGASCDEDSDCPGGVCQFTGGESTRPNGCSFACDAGVNLGLGCAQGLSAGGVQTTCNPASTNPGASCDEDSDCPGGACDVNPFECDSGNPSTEGNFCSTNVECAGGTCEDSCPGGRCVPLCLPDAGNAPNGVCAAGPARVHCEGGKFIGRDCDEDDANDTCDAMCSGGGSCTSQDDCPEGETCFGTCNSHNNCEAGLDGILGTGDDLVGAGACIIEDRGCFLDPVEGSGSPDPDNYQVANIWCFGATQNAGVNGNAGFGGPGRTIKRGVTVINVPSIP